MLEGGADSNKRSNQSRNRTANRRSSRERLDRMNSLGENGGSSVGGGAGGPSAIRANGAVGINSIGTVESHGAESNNFSHAEAAQLMNERWTAAINAAHNPSVDVNDRPVIYDGGSAWGSSKLHIQRSTVADFLQEVQQAIDQNASQTDSSRVSPNVREYQLF